MSKDPATGVSVGELYSQGQLTEPEYKLLSGDLFTTVELVRRLISLRRAGEPNASTEVADLFYGLELGVIPADEVMDRLRVFFLTGYLHAPEEVREAIENVSGPWPIDLLLFCPRCGEQHVDAAKPDVCETCGQGRVECPCPTFTEWLNPPHKSHRCTACNHVWRPGDIPTNGVLEIRTKGERDGDPRPARS